MNHLKSMFIRWRKIKSHFSYHKCTTYTHFKWNTNKEMILNLVLRRFNRMKRTSDRNVKCFFKLHTETCFCLDTHRCLSNLLKMKLLTYNFLTSKAMKGVKVGYPLKLQVGLDIHNEDWSKYWKNNDLSIGSITRRSWNWIQFGIYGSYDSTVGMGCCDRRCQGG